jgi:hypothetical protein
MSNGIVGLMLFYPVFALGLVSVTCLFGVFSIGPRAHPLVSAAISATFASVLFSPGGCGNEGFSFFGHWLWVSTTTTCKHPFFIWQCLVATFVVAFVLAFVIAFSRRKSRA